MDTLFHLAARLTDAREPFVLCTVAGTDKSAPRDSGAQMLVRADGSIAGTVGGGPLEAAVIGEARELLATGRRGTRLFEATLTTTGVAHLGMKCGGEVQVLLDLHRPASRVWVLGAGHVGLAVADAARVAGWDVVLADDRPERLALANGFRTRPFEADHVAGALGEVAPGDFVVIVTRCHDIDERALDAAIDTPARYVGLIGSRQKVAVVYRNLRQAGRPDPSQDGRVYAPIGIDIGGKEPGEIAIAVMAEMLAVRDARPAHHRRLPARSARSTDDTGKPLADDDASSPRPPE
jgi:xanthine dehydrogenase accessory factor